METMSKYFSKEDLRRKKWMSQKVDEFIKDDSNLTFAEWCYQQGKADAREINDCPYIVDKKCDIAKCEEFHIRADERAKTIDEAEKLLDKIAPDKVAEIKCYDGEIRNRPLIDFAKVYEIFEQMKGEQK